MHPVAPAVRGLPLDRHRPRRHRADSRVDKYWAAGERWSRKGTSYVIGENGWKPGEHEGEDRPQLKILMKYVELQKAAK